MNFTVSAWASGVTVGSSLGAVEVTSGTNLIAAQASPAVVNPLHTTQLTFPRPARIQSGISAGAIVVAGTGTVVEDYGLGIQVVPAALPTYTVTSTTAVAPQFGAMTVGGVTDTSYIQPV